MRSFKIAILVSGGGSNLQAIIDATLEQKINSQIVCVLSNKEGVYGLERAKNHNIPAFYINPKEEAYDERLLRVLKEKEVDLVVLAGYLKIISKEMIREFKDRIINIHPSLLPKYGGHGYYGIHVHRAVIANGETESGATVHYVDDGIDTGDIIIQRKVPVLSGDTPEDLQARVLEEVEHKILVEAIQGLEEQNS